MNLENYSNIHPNQLWFLSFLKKKDTQKLFLFSRFHYKGDLQGLGQQSIGKVLSTI